MTDDADTEERTIYVIIALVLLPVIVPVLWAHTQFDTGSTIALLGVCSVLAALVQQRRRPAALPPARARRPGARTHAGLIGP